MPETHQTQPEDYNIGATTIRTDHSMQWVN